MTQEEAVLEIEKLLPPQYGCSLQLGLKSLVKVVYGKIPPGVEFIVSLSTWEKVIAEIHRLQEAGGLPRK